MIIKYTSVHSYCTLLAKIIKICYQVCAGVDMSDHLVEVIFAIFDEDGDGSLSKKEFISVMKNKLRRGLEKNKDTGISNFFSAIVSCAIDRGNKK